MFKKNNSFIRPVHIILTISTMLLTHNAQAGEGSLFGSLKHLAQAAMPWLKGNDVEPQIGFVAQKAKASEPVGAVSGSIMPVHKSTFVQRYERLINSETMEGEIVRLRETGHLKDTTDDIIQRLLNNTNAIAEIADWKCSITQKEKNLRTFYFDLLKKVVLIRARTEPKAFLCERYAYPLIKCIDAKGAIVQPTLLTILAFQCSTPLVAQLPEEDRQKDCAFFKALICQLRLALHEWHEIYAGIKTDLSNKQGWSDVPADTGVDCFGKCHTCKPSEFLENIVKEAHSDQQPMRDRYAFVPVEHQLPWSSSK